MENELAVGVIFFALVIVLVVLSSFFSGETTKKNTRQPDSNDRIMQNRRKKANENYKAYIATHRAAALQNYRAYQRLCQSHHRRQQAKRVVQRFGRIISDAFPEINNPERRGEILRALIGHLLRAAMNGERLSSQWRQQMNEFIQDVDGVFTMKQELLKWFRNRQQEIDDLFKEGQLTEDEKVNQLEELEQVYHDALQQIHL